MDFSTPRTFPIAGVEFRPKDDLDYVKKELTRRWKTLPIHPVTLIGEPSNEYDRYAVRIELFGKHIGYVPKPINIDLWSAKSAGYKVAGELIAFNPDVEAYNMFIVRVTFDKVVKVNTTLTPNV